MSSALVDRLREYASRPFKLMDEPPGRDFFGQVADALEEATAEQARMEDVFDAALSYARANRIDGTDGTFGDYEDACDALMDAVATYHNGNLASSP